jgi:hypothetical protein
MIDMSGIHDGSLFTGVATAPTGVVFRALLHNSTIAP